MTCTAFLGTEKIGTGEVREVLRLAQEAAERDPLRTLLIFDDETAKPVVDYFPAPTAPASAGRPKLGVVGREVTLLPRHWDWLNAQPGGASVALRKLVEQARRENEAADRVRLSQEAAYRFMTAMAGDAPGFEEAIRALFARQLDKFQAETANWAPAVREYAMQLAAPGFADGDRA